MCICRVGGCARREYIGMRFGIIGAMETEVATLKKHMAQNGGYSSKRHAGMDFAVGKLGNAEAVVVKCGVGKVNAALCVQVLADFFEVTHIINTGVAGALNVNLDIGDILISTDALQHDVDVTALKYAPGQIPGVPVLAFPADPWMIMQAEKTAEALKNEPGFSGVSFIRGRVVSGDAFISDSAVKKRLIDEFRGDCCEMEGAAIAQAAYANNLPYVILRAISDRANGVATVDYPVFESQAAVRCSRFVEYMINRN